MTYFELATTINSLNMILEHHDSSVRLSRDSELATIENALNALNVLLNYLPDHGRQTVADLLAPFDSEEVA